MPLEECSWLSIAETSGENAAKDVLIFFLENQLLGSHREKFKRKYKYNWGVDQIWAEFHDPMCLHIRMPYILICGIEQYFGKNIKTIVQGMDGDNTFSSDRITLRLKTIQQCIGPIVTNIQCCAMEVLGQAKRGTISDVIVIGKSPLQEMVKQELLIKVPKGIKVSLLENELPLMRGALKCALDLSGFSK